MKKILFISLILFMRCGWQQRGCTDQIACNYDYSAESDDGNCIYPCETTSIDGECYLECCDVGDGDGNYLIMDCNGICGGEGRYDCVGVCDGETVRDECGICGGEGLQEGDTLIIIQPMPVENQNTNDSSGIMSKYDFVNDDGSLELYTIFTKSVGFCFNKNDLSALQILINNNATDNTFEYWASLASNFGLNYNNDNILDPLEFGIQEWINGRLYALALGLQPENVYFHSFNWVGKESALLEGIIPNSIGDLDHLEYLSLSNNKLSGSVPEAISNLQLLKGLDLRNNQLTSLPSTICDLPSDCVIKVSGNQLCEEYHYDCIDDWDGQMCKDGNCESGYSNIGICLNQSDLDVLQEFIDLNESLSGEETIDLSYQYDWKGDRLISLYLQSNQLTTLPESIGNLSSLEYLSLYSNQLTTLPESIGNLSSLEYLSLYSNQLTGDIPSEIGNLTNLHSLRLNNNQLTGEIPSSIGSLTNLTYLRLSSNQLTGEIPQEVCDLIESNNLKMRFILDGNNLTNTCE